jgi:magnesium transporter
MAKLPSDAPTGASEAGPRAGSLTAGMAAVTAAIPSNPQSAAVARPATGLAAGLVRVAVFEDGKCVELAGDDALVQLRAAVARPSALVWVDLTSPAPAQLSIVAGLLGMHPLLTEDLVERDQRAKIDKVDGMVHLVLFALGFDDGATYEREIDLVLGDRFLLTSHSAWWDPYATRHLRIGVAQVIGRGTAYLLWALADDIIDNYFPILDRLGDEIDDLEDKVVASADRSILERLFELKRELITIRRVTSPEREMFNILSSREESAISDEMRLYFRDAYDHLIRLTDELDTYRELASAALEAYLSTVNNNLSAIMKRLTGVTVVVAGVGAIGGLFGMSEAQYAFRLDEGPGFWIVVFGSLVFAALAAAFLRKIDWI